MGRDRVQTEWNQRICAAHDRIRRYEARIHSFRYASVMDQVVVVYEALADAMEEEHRQSGLRSRPPLYEMERPDWILIALGAEGDVLQARLSELKRERSARAQRTTN